MTFSRVKMKAGWTYVYRVEHSKDNSGPYRRQYRCNPKIVDFVDTLVESHSGSRWPGIWLDIEKSSSYPAWKEENKVKNYYAGFCGFDSMSSLQNWFSMGELKAMHKLGYVIKMYRVRESAVCLSYSGKQVVFIKPTFPTKIKKICDE